MCAIIGMIIQRPSLDDFETIRNVFLESRIRGMHATGISFVKDGVVKTIKYPINAKEFVDRYLSDMDYYVNEDGNIYMVGHCRYSTSDLEYNQPIANSVHSIVHNGVITQELPENWLEIFGKKTETKNDSEFVLLSEDPLIEFPDSSMSVCELTNDKKLKVYRNGKRPLSLTIMDNGCIITSTVDIAKRSGIASFTLPTEMNVVYTFDESLSMMYERIEENGHTDLQKYEFC